MASENDTDSLKKEKPVELIDEITQDLDQLHGDLLEKAGAVGYARDTFRAVRPLWEKIEGTSFQHSEAATLVASSALSLVATRDWIRGIRTQTAETLEGIPEIGRSAGTFATSSCASVSLVFTSSPSFSLPVPPPSLGDTWENYSKRFSKFDSALGDTYRAIYEALYATRANPERTALFLMRQAFDQFFGKLAPDEKVRSSKYWRRKEGDNPNQVYRRERIECAAHHYIRNEAQAEALAASAGHVRLEFGPHTDVFGAKKDLVRI
jgi:hypothetical protein